jgi:protein-tyrosine-phosphatase
VIAGAALAERRPDVVVRTAGTFVVDGQPMSWRTRAALAHVGIPVPPHRSRQASLDDIERTDLVVGLAPEHVAWVRRKHPTIASRTATLRRLARDLPDGDDALGWRLSQLGLADVAPEPWEDVVDPGGSEADAYAACAVEIVDLVTMLAERL